MSKRYTWQEFKKLYKNSELNNDQIFQLYKQELEKYRREDLVFLNNQRNYNLNQAERLNSYLQNLLIPPAGLTLYPNPENTIQLYDTPGTYIIRRPEDLNYVPYNQVTINAIGAGGGGTLGAKSIDDPPNSLSGYMVGSGGGSGGRIQLIFKYSSNDTISITVGAGGLKHTSRTSTATHGEDTTVTINGNTSSARGGKTAINTSPESVSNGQYNNGGVLYGGLGGGHLDSGFANFVNGVHLGDRLVSQGTLIGIAGDRGVPTYDLSNFSGVTNWPENLYYERNVNHYADIVGKVGGKGAGTRIFPEFNSSVEHLRNDNAGINKANTATFAFDTSNPPLEIPSGHVNAQDGFTPGAGGGGGIVIGSGENGNPGNGAAGAVHIIWGYQSKTEPKSINSPDPNLL